MNALKLIVVAAAAVAALSGCVIPQGRADYRDHDRDRNHYSDRHYQDNGGYGNRGGGERGSDDQH